jgi:hypothetical protein
MIFVFLNFFLLALAEIMFSNSEKKCEFLRNKDMMLFLSLSVLIVTYRVSQKGRTIEITKTIVRI